MIQWCWRGTSFCVDFSFFAVAAWIALRSGTMFFWMILSVCLLHELGHLTAMALFRRRVQSVALCGAGITIHPAETYGAYWQDIIVFLAGPIVNLCIGILLLWHHGITEMVVLHLGLGLFNLMPYARLDGGSILYAALSAREIVSDRTEQIQNLVSILFSAGLLSFAYFTEVKSIPLFAMIFYLLLLQLFVHP